MFHTSTEHNYPCWTVDCRNESWANNETLLYNASWLYEYHCDYKSSHGNFSASELFKLFVYIMYSIIVIFALVGNILVCIVIYKSPPKKTVTNYFIANLAVGDILMTVFCVPFSFVPTLILRYWPFGGLMCKVVNFTQAVSVFVTSYTLLALSIDRYLAIIQPLKPRLQKNIARIVVAAVWGCAVITAAPILFVTELQRPSLWHEVCKADICTEQWVDALLSRQYTCALLTLQFVLPLSALVFTYTSIAYVVWKLRPPGEAISVRDRRMQLSKRKMLKMMVIVVAVFTICWLPLNIFLIIWDAHSDDDTWVKWPGTPYVWFVCHWLAMSHSCYNPIIYCYMNRRYRRGFKQVFDSLLCRRVNQPTTCQNISICDGIPLSEIGVNVTRKAKSASTGQLAIQKCLRCTSLPLDKKSPVANTSRNLKTSARALSLQSHFA